MVATNFTTWRRMARTGPYFARTVTSLGKCSGDPSPLSTLRARRRWLWAQPVLWLWKGNAVNDDELRDLAAEEIRIMAEGFDDLLGMIEAHDISEEDASKMVDMIHAAKVTVTW